ncbi:hypothetical protein U3516DRAFT_769659 [Neocallimastix sp. 'constans']
MERVMRPFGSFETVKVSDPKCKIYIIIMLYLKYIIFNNNVMITRSVIAENIEKTNNFFLRCKGLIIYLGDENFHKWNSDLKLFLDFEELGDHISKNIKDIKTNTKQLKNMTGILNDKWIKRKIFRDSLLFTEYNKEAKLQNKSKMSEETKSFIFFRGIKIKLEFIKRVDIKEVYQYEDQINKDRNVKLSYNFNKETNFNEYCSKRNFKYYNNEINLEDNIELMDEYNNKNMLDNNSENKKELTKIKLDKINEDKIYYINEDHKLAKN